MNRRAFLKTLGLSSAGLLVPDYLLARGRSMVSLASLPTCALCDCGMPHYPPSHWNCRALQINQVSLYAPAQWREKRFDLSDDGLRLEWLRDDGRWDRIAEAFGP